MEQETQAFVNRCQAAMDAITEELGLDAWSRNLDDHVVAHAFCVPQSVYDNEELCEDLESWLNAVVRQYYLTFARAEWRSSSAEPDFPQNSLYEVDWCGSRHREVHLGPHLYVEFMPTLTCGRSLAQKPELPKWRVEVEEPDCYIVNVKTAE
jgi:hypothetical protein